MVLLGSLCFLGALGGSCWFLVVLGNSPRVTKNSQEPKKYHETPRTTKKNTKNHKKPAIAIKNHKEPHSTTKNC